MGLKIYSVKNFRKMSDKWFSVERRRRIQLYLNDIGVEERKRGER